MIPQGVAVRDMIKPDVAQAMEQAKAVLKRTADKVDLSQRARQKSEKEKSPVSLEKAVDKSNKVASTLNSKVEFRIDRETDTLIVKVVNKETGDIIRQIPSEDMVRLAARVDELRGLIFNDDG